MVVKIAIFLVALAFSPFSSGDVLLWTMTGSASVDNQVGSSVYTFLQSKPYREYEDDGIPYTEYVARIVVKDMNGTELAVLPTAYQIGYDPAAGGPQYEFDPDITDVLVGHPDAGYVGAAWNQSKVSGEMLAECLFQMQVLQDDSERGLTPILFSDHVDGHYLESEYNYGNGAVYQEGSIFPMDALPWTPDNFYTIDPVPPSPSAPEPSGGILMAIGFSLLVLGRRTR